MRRKSLLMDLFVFFERLPFSILFPDRTLERNVERLKEEEWFKSLISNWKFDYVIRSNHTIIQWLEDPKTVEQLIESTEVRKEFLELVKDAHQNFNFDK